jgi:fermentation-respiration switch protein FrsA (DUF1100 family)
MRARTLIALCLLLTQTACSGLLFHPSPVMERTPAQLGLAYEDVYFLTRDNVKLHGWYLPAKGKPVGSILYLHGNAENISTHIFNVAWLPARGFNVFAFDYRGYGLSGGEPSLPGVHRDFSAALHWLLKKPFAAEHGVVVFGQSLGGGIAIYGVAHSDVQDRIRALVVESALSSYRDIAREKLAGFFLTWPLQWPLSFAMPDGYSPIYAIPEIKGIPILIIHGDHDPIVPLHHGERLYAAATAPKAFWLVKGGGHIQAFTFEKYREKLVDYLDGVYHVPDR